MKDLTKIIRSILQEMVIDEAALRLNALPSTTILNIKKINQGREFVLYDPQSKNAYAAITFIQREQFGPDYFVTGVAAEKGFGPFIYELAMMHLSSKNAGLMPSADGDVRSEAWGVWKQFYHRSDVIKKTRPLEDRYFSFRYIQDHPELSIDEKRDWFEDINDKEETLMFNTAFSMPPDNQYYELLSRTKQWLDNGGNTEDAETAGENLWNKKYK